MILNACDGRYNGGGQCQKAWNDYIGLTHDLTSDVLSFAFFTLKEGNTKHNILKEKNKQEKAKEKTSDLQSEPCFSLN